MANKEVHVFDNHTLHIENEIQFSEEKINHYKERFSFYKGNGLIEGCQYSDRNWFIWTLGTRGIKLRISFDLDLFRNANDILKCYTMFLMDSGFAVKTIIQKIKVVKDSFYQTNNFSVDKVEDFYEYVLLEVPKSFQYNYITYNIELFNFFMPEYGQEFISRLKESDVKPYESKTKALPPFEDILTFSNELYDFYLDENASSELKEKYLPVYIWWQLTMFIPMRPQEFVQLQKSDLKKTNGQYQLTIKRSKPKYPHHITPQTEFYITKDIGELIESYIHLSEHYCTEDVSEEEQACLLPMYMRQRYHTDRSQKISKVISHGRTIHISTSMFNSLLKNFYTEVIQSDDIESFTPNSTRHLAICNMRMQGIDPLTISKMAGHASLFTQNHYANHIETFLDSKVRLLSEQIKNKQMKVTDFYTIEEVENLPIVQNLKTESVLNRTERKYFKQIEGGYCTDTEFPRNCLPSCLLCPFFLLEMRDRGNTLRLLDETSKRLNKQYKDQLETYYVVFRKLMSNMNQNKELINPSIDLNEQVNSVTKSINKTIEELARTEALIMQVAESNESEEG